MSFPWRVDEEGVDLLVRLTPKGGRDSIEGVEQDAESRSVLKVRVAAPPVDGAANAALVKLIANTLGTAKRDVAIQSGETARTKRLRISGDVAEIVNRLRRSAGVD